jgi:hypothetical protein
MERRPPLVHRGQFFKNSGSSMLIIDALKKQDLHNAK